MFFLILVCFALCRLILELVTGMSSAGSKRVDGEKVQFAMFRVNDRLRIIRGLGEQTAQELWTLSSATILELKALRRAFSDDPQGRIERAIVDVWEKAQMKRVADRINRNAPVKVDKVIILNPEEEARAVEESARQLQTSQIKPFKRLSRGPLRAISANKARQRSPARLRSQKKSVLGSSSHSNDTSHIGGLQDDVLVDTDSGGEPSSDELGDGDPEGVKLLVDATGANSADMIPSVTHSSEQDEDIDYSTLRMILNDYMPAGVTGVSSRQEAMEREPHLQQSDEETVLVEDVSSDDSEYETARHSAASRSDSAEGNNDIDRLIVIDRKRGGAPTANEAEAKKARAEEAEAIRAFEAVRRTDIARGEWATVRRQYAERGVGPPGRPGFYQNVDYWYKMLEPPPFSAAKKQVWGRHAYYELLTWSTQMDLIETFFADKVMAKHRRNIEIMKARLEDETKEYPVTYNAFIHWKEAFGTPIMQDIANKFEQMATGKSKIQLDLERAEAEYPADHIRVKHYRRQYEMELAEKKDRAGVTTGGLPSGQDSGAALPEGARSAGSAAQNSHVAQPPKTPTALRNFASYTARSAGEEKVPVEDEVVTGNTRRILSGLTVHSIREPKVFECIWDSQKRVAEFIHQYQQHFEIQGTVNWDSHLTREAQYRLDILFEGVLSSDEDWVKTHGREWRRWAPEAFKFVLDRYLNYKKAASSETSVFESAVGALKVPKDNIMDTDAWTKFYMHYMELRDNHCYMGSERSFVKGFYKDLERSRKTSGQSQSNFLIWEEHFLQIRGGPVGENYINLPSLVQDFVSQAINAAECAKAVASRYKGVGGSNAKDGNNKGRSQRYEKGSKSPGRSNSDQTNQKSNDGRPDTKKEAPSLLCWGCGRTGHKSNECGFRKQPDFNEEKVPYAQSTTHQKFLKLSNPQYRDVLPGKWNSSGESIQLDFQKKEESRGKSSSQEKSS